MSTLASRVAAARRAANLTQAELASRLGVDKGKIARIERGDRETLEASIKFLYKIAQEVGVPMRTLIGIGEFGTVTTREAILDNPRIPKALRELAHNEPLYESLSIQDDEWHALSTVELPGPIDRDGYVNLLLTIRSLTGRVKIA